MNRLDDTEAVTCDVAELRATFLFESLEQEQVEWLAQRGSCRTFEPGWIYRRGQRAESFFVLLSGQVVMYEVALGEEVEVARATEPGSYGGALGAYLSEDLGATYSTSMKALRSSRLFVLPATAFSTMMREWFPLSVHLLQGLAFGTRSALEATEQRGQLLALGSLTAGLAHELNNPAAAALAATTALRNRAWRARETLQSFAAHDGGTHVIDLLQLHDVAMRDADAPSPRRTALETADLQEDLAAWLDAHGVTEGWDLAPALVQAGVDPPFLELVLTEVGSTLLEDAVRWLSSSVEIEMLMREILESVGRVSTLVDRVKQYTDRDRAPRQVVDVADLLDSTLRVFARRLAETQVRVVKDFTPGLPPVLAYPAELDQVWTNLVDNALDAMDDDERPGGRDAPRTLTVRTYCSDSHRDHVVVEVIDTGPGVPPERRARIFEPFFTTKAFGHGTGLGLDLASRIVTHRHHGQVHVESEPGRTRMIVTLPAEPSGTSLHENDAAPHGRSAAT